MEKTESRREFQCLPVKGYEKMKTLVKSCIAKVVMFLQDGEGGKWEDSSTEWASPELPPSHNKVNLHHNKPLSKVADQMHFS